MKPNTRRLTESAIMIALASVLSLCIIFQAPFGGSVTLASMVPIILISLKYDVRWAIITSVAYAGIQMLLGFYAPPVQDFLSFLLVILLDYVLAFGVLGLAGTFGRLFKKPIAKIVGGGAIVIGLRFVCHFTSGIVIWASDAPAGQPAWLYSLGYNGSYMLFELIISVAILLVLSRVIIKYLLPKDGLGSTAK
ncbi:MAG: energy-coupled thiamine transporter ThiT [Eubacteriales bacterium]